jgi:DNA-binding NarL/FixJ family response regulator
MATRAGDGHAAVVMQERRQRSAVLDGVPVRVDVSARVLIVEDQPVLRNVIRMACESSPHLEVAAEVASGAEAVHAYPHLFPDLVLIDLSLPDMSGLEVARRLRREVPRPRILVLSGRTDDETLFDTIRAGVDGYLEKTMGVRHITEALERLAAGERLFTPEQERSAIEGLGRLARRAREASDVSPSITLRELVVLRLLGEGLTMRQVASRLRVSTGTVEAHVAKLYPKLDASNRVQALAKAADLGLIELR